MAADHYSSPKGDRAAIPNTLGVWRLEILRPSMNCESPRTTSALMTAMTETAYTVENQPMKSHQASEWRPNRCGGSEVPRGLSVFPRRRRTSGLSAVKRAARIEGSSAKSLHGFDDGGVPVVPTTSNANGCGIIEPDV